MRSGHFGTKDKVGGGGGSASWEVKEWVEGVALEVEGEKSRIYSGTYLDRGRGEKWG